MEEHGLGQSATEPKAVFGYDTEPDHTVDAAQVTRD